MTKYNSCPHCGVEDGDHDEGTPFLTMNRLGRRFAVTCNNCGCRGPARSTEVDAHLAWNERAKPSDQEERREQEERWAWDDFAAAALTGIYSSAFTDERCPPCDKVAIWASDMADAMMTERAKRQGSKS